MQKPTLYLVNIGNYWDGIKRTELILSVNPITVEDVIYLFGLDENQERVLGIHSPSILKNRLQEGEFIDYGINISNKII